MRGMQPAEEWEQRKGIIRWIGKMRYSAGDQVRWQGARKSPRRIIKALNTENRRRELAVHGELDTKHNNHSRQKPNPSSWHSIASLVMMPDGERWRRISKSIIRFRERNTEELLRWDLPFRVPLFSESFKLVAYDGSRFDDFRFNPVGRRKHTIIPYYDKLILDTIWSY